MKKLVIAETKDIYTIPQIYPIVLKKILSVLFVSLFIFSAGILSISCGNGQTDDSPSGTQKIADWQGIPVYLDGGTQENWDTVKTYLDSIYDDLDSQTKIKLRNNIGKIFIKASGGLGGHAGGTLSIPGDVYPNYLYDYLLDNGFFA